MIARKNEPWGTEIKSDSVKCIFRIPVRLHDQFAKDILQVKAVVGPLTLSKGETRYFIPDFEGIPSYARLVQTDSVKVRRY